MNTPTATKRRVEIYDTTLRDGTQGEGVNLSLVDKLKITQLLDSVGIDFVEGGYPLSNPKDEAYFKEVQKLDLKHTKVCAFGMTRRKDIDPADDAGMNALVASGSPIITIVGKTWDLHVDEVLRISRDENLAMITDSLAFCNAGPDCEEVFYDAEHFFDGYRSNKDYALATLRAALDGGASRLVLCDTNGGSMPGWITQAVTELYQALGEDVQIAIHTHNDAGLAVANSLAAVQAGAVQVQGTINGIGERCGNVDLTTVIANLRLKLGYDCLTGENLDGLTKLSRAVYERANLSLSSCQPYVGTSAFAHKGGMHVHAVQRITHSYEHVEPALVGNERRILVSELSGASNISATLGEKFSIQDDKDLQRKVLKRVQDLEHQGYHFEAAQASFELLLYDAMGKLPDFWELDHYRCVILRRGQESPTTEATVKLRANDMTEHRVAEGDGPVNALDGALRKALKDHYPQLNNVHLADYKVRVVNPTAESAAKVRVIAEFAVRENGDDSVTRYITTIGVNENIIDASWQAIADAFRYHLVETTAPVRV
jgi:2-isopropylmalate synthase